MKMLSKIRSLTTRREFLKQSAIAAGTLAFLHRSNWSFAEVKSPLAPNALANLRKSFSGQLVIPGDAGYEAARIPSMNPEMEKFPAVVAQCANDDDVLRCIDFAHQQKLEVAVRSGNHSYLGWGTCNDGMVIDLSKMKSVKVDPAQQTALVSTGNTAEEVLTAAAPHGLAPVLGECGTVGAGLALGGGLGWLLGRFGATSDNLLSARLISADGRTLTTDSATHSDLFWAIRGGGGNFGVATSFQYQLHPLKEFLAASFSYPAAKSRQMLRHFRQFMATAPDDLQPGCWLTNYPSGKFVVELVWTGSFDDGERLVQTFRSFSPPEQEWVKRTPLSQLYRVEDDIEFAPFPFLAAKGTYIEQLSDDAIDLILDRFAQPPPSCALTFNFSHYMHGQVCRIAPDATAFGLRKADALHLVQLIQWRERADTATSLLWHNQTFDLLQPYSRGHIYANYASIEGESAANRTYGSNYARLRELKKKYDPQNFFRLNQNILPA